MNFEVVQNGRLELEETFSFSMIVGVHQTLFATLVNMQKDISKKLEAMVDQVVNCNLWSNKLVSLL